MSIVKHGDGVSLELTVRSVYNEERFGMGGIIDADYFDKHPYEAALLSLAPYYHRGIYTKEISDFLQKYSLSFDYAEEIENIDEFTQQYIDELDELVKLCKTKMI